MHEKNASLEEALIRKLDRDVGGLFTYVKGSPMKIADLDPSAGGLVAELRAAAIKEAAIRGKVVGKALKQMGREAKDSAKGLLDKAFPSAKQRVRDAEAAAAATQAETAQAMAAKGLEAVETMPPWLAYEKLFPKKQMSTSVRAALTGGAAGAIPAGAYLLSKEEKAASMFMSIKLASMDPTHTEGLISDLVHESDVLPNIQVKVADAGKAFLKLGHDIQAAHESERRHYYTKVEIEDIADAYAKVANALGYDVTASELVDYLDKDAANPFKRIGQELVKRKVLPAGFASRVGEGVRRATPHLREAKKELGASLAAGPGRAAGAAMAVGGAVKAVAGAAGSAIGGAARAGREALKSVRHKVRNRPAAVTSRLQTFQRRETRRAARHGAKADVIRGDAEFKAEKLTSLKKDVATGHASPKAVSELEKDVRSTQSAMFTQQEKGLRAERRSSGVARAVSKRTKTPAAAANVTRLEDVPTAAASGAAGAPLRAQTETLIKSRNKDVAKLPNWALPVGGAFLAGHVIGKQGSVNKEAFVVMPALATLGAAGLAIGGVKAVQKGIRLGKAVRKGAKAAVKAEQSVIAGEAARKAGRKAGLAVVDPDAAGAAIKAREALDTANKLTGTEKALLLGGAGAGGLILSRNGGSKKARPGQSVNVTHV